MKIVELKTDNGKSEKRLEWTCDECGHYHLDYYSHDEGPHLEVVCSFCGSTSPIDEV